MHMRVTLRLGNHKGSPECQLPRQQLPNHSLVCTQTMAVTALRLSTLCSGLPLPVPHSRRWLLSPGAQGPRGPGGTTPQLPPGPAASQAFSGKLGIGRTNARLWGRTPSAQSETQGHPGSWPQLAHLLKEYLKEAELGKKEKGGGLGTRAALSSPVPSVFL